jgi:hypothetical protein
VAKEHEQKNKSQQPNTTGSSVAEENPDWEANNEFITIYAEEENLSRLTLHAKKQEDIWTYWFMRIDSYLSNFSARSHPLACFSDRCVFSICVFLQFPFLLLFFHFFC